MAEDQKSSRDRHGRWVKGVTRQPQRAPKQIREHRLRRTRRFMNTVLEVTTPEGRTMMTREAAIQHRLYQSAMQGNVHAQIYLSRRFETGTREGPKPGRTSASWSPV